MLRDLYNHEYPQFFVIDSDRVPGHEAVASDGIVQGSREVGQFSAPKPGAVYPIQCSER